MAVSPSSTQNLSASDKVDDNVRGYHSGSRTRLDRPLIVGAAGVFDHRSMVDRTFFGQLAGAVLGQAGIGVFEMVYQVVLVVDAGRRKNIVQIVGVCLNNVAILALVAISLPGVSVGLDLFLSNGTIRHGGQHIVYVYRTIVGLLASTTFLMVVVTWLGSREFEW